MTSGEPIRGRPLCYIAGPYRAPNVLTDVERVARIAENARAAAVAGLAVAARGWVPVVPHTMTLTMAVLDTRQTISEAQWLEITLALCLRCDGILMIDGWEDSVGARAEAEAMLGAKKPVWLSIGDVPWIV